MGVRRKGSKNKLSVSIGKLKLDNPVMVASGTFGYGEEYRQLVNIDKLGAVVTKSVTLEPYAGNSAPRIWETTAGMLNAIGLQNEGIDDFIKNKLPEALGYGTQIIVSIAGKTKKEYSELSKKLNKTQIDAIEINISCPNIEHKSTRRLFAQDSKATADIVRAVRRNTKKPIIAKLSPNVTDITEIAKAAEKSGADAISLINTLLGMEVDIVKREPRLGNLSGGLSGPAIKPIALHMVWQAYQAVKIPIIGIGGIMNTEDAIEFLLCGASAVQVGTANFVNPNTANDIIDGVSNYLKANNLKSITDITGKLKT